MQFDDVIDRSPTHAFKWEKYKGRDILPMWVADTEFRCPEPILNCIKSRVEHGVLGYTLPAHFTPANEAVVDWCARQYEWDIRPEHIVWMPGVVPAFNVACKACCEEGDKVMVMSPNYPPLLAAPALNKLERVDIPTLNVDGRWLPDFDLIEHFASDPKCKLFVVCNPMNPVGTVLTGQELNCIIDICQRHGVKLCSDEIHCDLILDPMSAHIPAGKADPTAITLMAASKTFNIAGLGAAFAIIPDAATRAKFSQAAQGMVPWVNVLGLSATSAAFTQCDAWHKQLLAYLRGNRDYLYEQVNSMPGLEMLLPQATFLAWIDASGLQLDNPQHWCEQRGVGPSPGSDFGAPQYFRINFGCPRQQLEMAMTRLQK